jgi:hypothetical protein
MISGIKTYLQIELSVEAPIAVLAKELFVPFVDLQVLVQVGLLREL